MSTCILIVIAVMGVRIDDMTAYSPPPTPAQDAEMSDVPTIRFDDESAFEPRLSKAEEDALVRQSTPGFPGFVSGFYRAMLNLFDNLPEPGKSGKTGGKVEESMLSSVNAACEIVTASLSPSMFDQALNIFIGHVSSSPRANSAKAVGHMAACFARADSKKTLKALYDLCDTQIRIEIDSGAASSPTTSSSTPMEGDTTLQWYCLLLSSAVAQAGAELLPYGDRILSLLQHMYAKCKSERAYQHTGRVLAWAIASPITYWIREAKFLNADEMSAPGESSARSGHR